MTFNFDLHLAKIFLFLMVFFRSASIIMMIPLFSETFIPARFRILIAFIISLMIFDSQVSYLPSYSEDWSTFTLAFHLITQVTIGLIFGLTLKIILESVTTAGHIISMQTGYSAAQFFDKATEVQSTAIGNLMLYVVLAHLYVNDMHHAFILALVDSFELFSSSNINLSGNFADSFLQLDTQKTQLMQEGNSVSSITGLMVLFIKKFSWYFLISFKLAAPFIVITLSIHMASGILSKLMPNLQVFFVLTPANMLMAIFMLSITINISAAFILDCFSEALLIFH